MHRILEGVRVLDLTRFFSGPQATLYLAGLGAEVIRIDSPTSADTASNAPPYAGAHGVAFERRSPDDIGVNFLKRGRGKKAICLDLKRAEGLELFMRLVEQADVVELFDNPKHPYTKALLKSVPDLDDDVDMLPTIEGQPPDLANTPSGCVFRDRCPNPSDDCKEGNIEMAMIEVSPGHWVDQCCVNCGEID